MADTSVQKTVKSAHFIGIGGAGMSGIAPRGRPRP